VIPTDDEEPNELPKLRDSNEDIRNIFINNEFDINIKKNSFMERQQRLIKEC
jgi:hypothetical protein